MRYGLHFILLRNYNYLQIIANFQMVYAIDTFSNGDMHLIKEMNF
jgi:hypothetical protein